jgi:hypothetical protein
MKRTLLVSLIALFSVLIASAQHDYVEGKAVKNINLTTLSCNQGGESFSSFIRQFAASATVRTERTPQTVVFAAADNMVMTGRQTVVDVKTFAGEEAGQSGFRAYSNTKGGNYSAGMYAVISADEVVFRTVVDSMCYCERQYVFTRIDGKWYITKYYTSM